MQLFVGQFKKICPGESTHFFWKLCEIPQTSRSGKKWIMDNVGNPIKTKSENYVTKSGKLLKIPHSIPLRGGVM